MIRSTGMGSDTAVLPTIHGMATTVNRKEAAQGVVPAQRRKRPQDLIPKQDASNEVGISRRSDQHFRWSGASIVGLAGLEPAASSLSGIEG
jgi:hypothetical protein